jgi:hypothetical protein
MVHTVNLPVGTITDIINIDDPNVLVPIESVVESFNEDAEKTVRSMYSMPDINEKIVKYESDISYITSCKKEPIVNTHKVRYFKVHVKYFPSEKEVDLIIPSYVKLFSRTAKSYVPVEFIRKSDILTDYTGNIVQVFTNEQVTDFEPTEYYSINLNTNNNKYLITFYCNGIFANVCYNNFNIKPVDPEPGE